MRFDFDALEAVDSVDVSDDESSLRDIVAFELPDQPPGPT